MKKSLTHLFTPLKLGPYQLPNRICMAAMTRCRADPSTGIPNELHVDYYSQRASSGLILTECSQILPTGSSFPGSTGIHSNEQVEGWKKVISAVHNKGGRIFLQIWHGGRSVLPDFAGGVQPISSTDQAIREQIYTPNGMKDHVKPRPMVESDFKIIKEAFKKGAENAIKAGFDGVELHGANGYLIDQFLRNSCNNRSDQYGGSIENRCKFPLEVIDILISVFGKERVGIKVSPTSRYQDMSDSDPIPLYTHLLKELSKKEIGFVEVVEKGEALAGKSIGFHPKAETQFEGSAASHLRQHFKGVYIANNNFNAETANKCIENNESDLVTFARLYLANPDLVERLKNGWKLGNPKINNLYVGGKIGYSDYPFYQEK